MSATTGVILLVEDELRLREPLEYLLRLRDFDVITADTSDDALRLIETHRPDAAIVDLRLRQGSGREVVVRMPPQVPVIIFSGTRGESAELEDLRPHTVLVEKPCSLVWLIDRLGGMLHEASGPH